MKSEDGEMARSKVKNYINIYACYLIYSLCLVFAKLAAKHDLFSLNAFGLYGLAFMFLGIFALVWQQVLKRMPLTIAYANRAVTIIYGMIFSALIFSEEISWNMVLGAVVIICGVVLVVKKHE